VGDSVKAAYASWDRGKTWKLQVPGVMSMGFLPDSVLFGTDEAGENRIVWMRRRNGTKGSVAVPGKHDLAVYDFACSPAGVVIVCRLPWVSRLPRLRTMSLPRLQTLGGRVLAYVDALSLTGVAGGRCWTGNTDMTLEIDFRSSLSTDTGACP